MQKKLYRPTYAVIDLSALKHNYEFIKRVIPRGVGVMAMVKADAYGHGVVEVSRTLEDCGVNSFGVATVEEGLELREAGIKSPIVVMGGLLGLGSFAANAMIEADLTPVIHSASVLPTLERAAKNKRLNVHLKVDTGMNRLGARMEAMPYLISRIKKFPRISVEGVMTHLAQAGKNSYTKNQVELFSDAKRLIEKELGDVPIWHLANSSAIFNDIIRVPNAKKILVRPGLGLYGSCAGENKKRAKLKPVMTLISRIALLKHAPKGSKVSYDSTYAVKRDSILAVVPIGYADGYPWSVSGKAHVLVNKRKVMVVGRVTMDMIVLDVTDLDNVEVGSEVVLMGNQGRETISVDDVARWAGTIPYEIFCGISKRMPRIYR